MRKLSHIAAVSVLRDTATLGEANATSGDPRLAAEGRTSALLATILLMVVSSMTKEEWGALKLASYNKNDVKDVDEETSILDGDDDGNKVAL